MSTDAVRAALAELVCLHDSGNFTPLSEAAIFALTVARAALSEPAPGGDVAQWLASVAADGYRTGEERFGFAARILLRIATTQQEPDKQLCTFYGVDTFPALVEAMEHHIKKLQAKLPQNDMPAATKTRFA